MPPKKQLYLEKRPDGSLYPSDGDSAEIWSEMREGTWLFTAVPAKQPCRNVYFHRKYFKMITLAFENQERFPTVDSLRDAVTIEAGFYEPLYTFEGIRKKAKSLAFHSMSEEEFQVLYSNSVNVLMKSFGWHREMFNMLMSFI